MEQKNSCAVRTAVGYLCYPGGTASAQSDLHPAAIAAQLLHTPMKMVEKLEG
jgi:hypothetical protein